MIVGEAKSLPLTLRHAVELERERDVQDTIRSLIQFAAACVIAAVFSAVAVSCIHPGQNGVVRDPVALCRGVAAQADVAVRDQVIALCPLLVVALESGAAPAVAASADAGGQ